MMNPTSSPGAALTLVDSLHRLVDSEAGRRGFTFLGDGESDASRITFHDLDREAGRVAAGLRKYAQPGDRVVLLFPPGLEFLSAFYGTLYAGMIAVPVAPFRQNRSNPQFRSILSSSSAALVLTVRSTLSQATAAATTSESRWLAIEDLLDAAGDSAGVRVEPGPEDLAVLQYTSGTTGASKGVMLPHRALLENLDQMRKLLDLAPEKTGVCWLPSFHDMGLIGNLLQAVHCGADITLMAPVAFVQKPIRWLRAISATRAHVSGGPNFAFDHCARTITPDECAGLDLSSWRAAYIGAEPIVPATLDRFVAAFEPYGFRRSAFFPCFGLAEATLMVTGGHWSAEPILKSVRVDALEANRVEPAEPEEDSGRVRVLVGCGQPVAGLDVRIVEPESRVACAPGQVGEIWVAGPSVGKGYWAQPEETERTFQARIEGDESPVRYLRTGDAGFLDAGELYISGRLKDLIIIRGRNYYPHDIEAVFDGIHPELKAGGAAAFAPVIDDSPRLVLVHEVQRRFRKDAADEVVEAIRTAVTEAFELEVHAIILVKTGSLPRTSSGKCRRGECERLYMADELDTVHRWECPRAPEAEAESETRCEAELVQHRTRAEVRAWLTDRMARHLGLAPDRVDPDRPFAAFGLDSITMVRIAADLEAWLGRPLPATLLYEAPTIAAVARMLAAHEPDDQPRSGPGAAATPRHEPIAVIGIGCRFPGADSPEAFWDLLVEGRDAARELPPGRWSRVPSSLATRQGGFLDDVDQFDAQFFGIAPREAKFIDPQHRLLLEVAWEALEDAAQAPDRLAGGRVGVFVGISGSDYGRMMAVDPESVDAYGGTGGALSMAASRLSYHLDLRGPSLVVDTACSSSLVAVQLACRSILEGRCELALVGGVNLMLAPELSVALSQAQMLSPSGRCRTFDAAADGYLRGEGCGVVVLKPLSAALHDNDRVLAVIRGTAVNQDGRSNGITAPNGAAQVALICEALDDAAVRPDEIGCVEAHGTGTVLGDPIEFDALQTAIGAGDRPCVLGSVKTNIGHLESAAGIAGFIKAVLQLSHETIAPLLHLKAVNPHIHLDGTRFVLPTSPLPWKRGESRRLAGVSSFGFGGANAHVILEEGPAPAASPRDDAPDRPAHLLTLAARTETALRELAARYETLLATTSESLADIAHTANIGRAALPHRVIVRAATRDAARAALQSYRNGRTTGEGLHVANLGHASPPKIAFLFTGQGSQYPGMARELHKTSPTFRSAFDRCAAILDARLPRPLSAMLDPESAAIDATACAQPALFAVEYALAETWRSWGVQPAAVMGHSFGEYVAACVAGVFPLEAALGLIIERARLMEERAGEGAMAAVFATPEAVAARIAATSEDVAIAAINGPRQITISGAPTAIERLLTEFRREGTTAQRLAVTRGFHSPAIEPALAEFGRVAAGVAHAPPTIPLISNLTARPVGADILEADYWVRHARSPVRFMDSIRDLREQGFDLFLEIGPTATLSGLGREIEPSDSTAWLPSLRKGRPDWDVLLESLARLAARGIPVDWDGFDAPYDRRRVALPTTPFEHQRFWIDPPKPRTEAPPAPATVAAAWVPSPCASEFHNTSARDLPAPSALAESLDPAATPARSQTKGHANGHGHHHRHEFSSRDGLTRTAAEFDRLAAGYFARALRELGFDFEPNARFTPQALADRLGVVPAQRRLFGRMLEVLAEEGTLRRQGEAWMVNSAATASAPANLETLRARYPEHVAELTLATRCGEHLTAILRGDCNPLQVLFPEGSTELLERIYQQSPFARPANDFTANAVARAIAGLPADRPVRILEIGAGTGGTTAFVLAKLPTDRSVEYVFSDVSNLFMMRAQERFAGRAGLAFRVLDIERDPAQSGFEPHRFDIVIAANVLHATRDLRVSLNHVQRLLAPDGLLALIEGTSPQRWLDLIFGLTEGWWKFADTDLRPNYPLIDRASWTTLLESVGFRDTAFLPQDAATHGAAQSVILSRAPAAAVAPRCSQAPTAAHDLVGWIILADQAGAGEALAARIRRAGGRSLLVQPGQEFACQGPELCRVRPLREADYHGMLAYAQAELGTPRLGLVHLWGLDGASAPWTNAVGSLTPLAQAWRDRQPTDRDPSNPAPFGIVTRGGVATANIEHPASDQAALWALGTALGALCPIRQVDLDPNAAIPDDLDQWADDLLDATEHAASAYRHGQRLKPATEATSDATAYRLATPATVTPPPAPVSPQPSDPAPGIARQDLLNADADSGKALLEDFLRAELARVLGLAPDAIDRLTPVNRFGLDSLMAIQLKNRAESQLEISMSVVLLLEGLSIRGIAERIWDDCFASSAAVDANKTTPYRNGNGNGNGKGHAHHPLARVDNGINLTNEQLFQQMSADIDVLSESDLDALLDDLMIEESPDREGPGANARN